jgi:hypothetical protein
MKGNLSSLIHLSKKHYIMETIFPRGPAKSLLPKNNLSLLVSSSIESRIRWGIINKMQPQVIHQEPHRDLEIRMLEERSLKRRSSTTTSDISSSEGVRGLVARSATESSKRHHEG